MVGCPIRIPADQIVCADPRSFSQLVTSFVASESLGIPHTPLNRLLVPICFLAISNFVIMSNSMKLMTLFKKKNAQKFYSLVFFVSNMSMNVFPLPAPQRGE